MKTEPSLSVNKLGEYLVASPYRQRKILEGLKYPKDDGGNWGWVHGEARNSIKDFFNGDLDEKYLLDCIKLLENRARTFFIHESIDYRNFFQWSVRIDNQL